MQGAWCRAFYSRLNYILFFLSYFSRLSHISFLIFFYDFHHFFFNINPRIFFSSFLFIFFYLFKFSHCYSQHTPTLKFLKQFQSSNNPSQDSNRVFFFFGLSDLFFGFEWVSEQGKVASSR